MAALSTLIRFSETGMLFMTRQSSRAFTSNPNTSNSLKLNSWPSLTIVFLPDERHCPMKKNSSV